MSEIDKRKSNLLSWIKSHPLLVLLILILLLSFILRIWVFNLTKEQALWWDEGDYMYAAKHWGLNLESRDLWYYRRVFLVPSIYAAIFKIGGSETTIRFFQVILSTLLVFFTYKIGKELFNQKVGLVAAFGLAVNRLYLFYTGRLLTDYLSLAFLLPAYLFFYKGYIKNEGNKYVYLAALLLGLSFFSRLGELLALVPLFIYVILKSKFSFLKDKRIWISLLIIILVMTPFLYQYKKHYPSGVVDFFKHYTQLDVPQEQRQLPWLAGIPRYIFDLLPNTSWFLFTIFLVGLLSFYDVILGFDMLFKPESEGLRQKLFLLAWIAIPIIVHGMITEIDLLEERYIMLSYPALFIVMGIGFTKIEEYFSKYSKIAVNIILILILLFGAYSQITAASALIKDRANSYDLIKKSGIWLNHNSDPSDIIISQSRPVHGYYTERTIWSPSEFKNASLVSLEENFEKNLSVLNPRYFVVSRFEQHPPWAYNYGQKKNLKVAQAWFADAARTQPVLVIYEFPREKNIVNPRPSK